MRPGLHKRTLGTFVLTALVALVATVLGAAPAVAQPEHSDAVRVWNLHASDALINAPTAATPGAGQPPPVSQLHLAMVQGAVYDAVNAIVGGYQPYLPDLPPASRSASQDAAVATAAHDVLVGLGIAPVPPLPQVVRDRLDALYTAALAGIPDGDAKTEGVAAGAAAAAAMLEARTNDGRFVPLLWQVGTEPGEWRPTPPEPSNALAWVAQVEPFTLESTSQFRTKGPNALTSGAYAKDYNEVKDLGAVGSPRTPEQIAVTQVYSAHPPELFNRTFRVISEAEGLTLAEEARLFAMLNLATADSVINCFDDKGFWNFWRPVTAIHEGDNDGNHKTVGDPAWTPLLAGSAVFGSPVWLQLRLGRIHGRCQGLLRHGQDGLQRRQDRAWRARCDARLHAIHRRGRRHHRRARVPRSPLPGGRNPGRRDRQERCPLA